MTLPFSPSPSPPLSLFDRCGVVEKEQCYGTTYMAEAQLITRDPPNCNSPLFHGDRTRRRQWLKGGGVGDLVGWDHRQCHKYGVEGLTRVAHLTVTCSEQAWGKGRLTCGGHMSAPIYDAGPHGRKLGVGRNQKHRPSRVLFLFSFTFFVFTLFSMSLLKF